MTTETIHAGTCSCGAGTVQLFRTGKCAHCYIAELEAKYAAECDASMMAGSQNSALRLQIRDSTAQTMRLRDDVIEQCATIADREWVGENSLIGSRIAGTIAKSIRALKS